MPTTIHNIRRYSVQVLNKKTGGKPMASIIVRLYNENDEDCGAALFKEYNGQDPELPVGDFKSQRATVYYDIPFFQAFIDILRREDTLFWKIAWVQLGAGKEISNVSLDTKKEIVGEFFSRVS